MSMLIVILMYHQDYYIKLIKKSIQDKPLE